MIKPSGEESFSRAILNSNYDIVDKNMIALALCAVTYGAVTKEALVKDVNGKPSSQTISGPNGLEGSMTWSFTATTITETLSITSPTAFTIVKTYNLTDLSEEWTVS